MRKILFDLFGLFMKVQTDEGVAGIHRAARLDEFGVDRAQFDHLYRALRDPLDAGTQDYGQYLDAIGAKLGVDFRSIPGLVSETELADVQSWSAHHQDMTTWLEELHDGGFHPNVLSNVPATHLAWLKENKPWIDLFDVSLFSCELGLAKPDPAIYRAAIEALGEAGDNILFFDDTYANVVGAREAGLRALHFVGIDQAKRDVTAFLAGHDLGRED
ncbi:HAD-IA family hydrolase [Arcanobacterium pinnipediorum]|uniref:HAD-IA family hydrolase n=1 Tax=Arcanobacterium pinnipediorum TaxID=1503041 RepID=A0ABY5AGQ4_9ACTO|nr:HAD-IA family hydrolase [Arcanobacterium pinnipediorum]USR79385.1 HAD-IA family hydrolase [Arcanobacterium pinnipediorum]